LPVLGLEAEELADGFFHVRRTHGHEGGHALHDGLHHLVERLGRVELVHEEDVLVLPQRLVDPLLDAVHVGADLALGDEAQVVAVAELDGGLQHGHEAVLGGVEVLHDGGQKGALAAAALAVDHPEPAPESLERLQKIIRQLVRTQERNVVRDDPHGEGQRTALAEQINPEAGQPLNGV